MLVGMRKKGGGFWWVLLLDCETYGNGIFCYYFVVVGVWMAWLMFKDSGGYQYRGKKCDGFPSLYLHYL